MERDALRLSRHGSHEHSLQAVPAAQFCTLQLQTTCSICHALIPFPDEIISDPSSILAHHCGRCCFWLCRKCFNIDETPLSQPWLVVRNPAISRYEAGLCIRSRPNQSAYCLCEISASYVIEVVSQSYNASESKMYYRVQHGGWIDGNDVVCVVPTRSSIATLIQLHVDYDQRQDCEPLDPRMLITYTEECLQLEAMGYREIMGFYLLLPIYLHVQKNWCRESTALLHGVNLMQSFLGPMTDELREILDSKQSIPPTVALLILSLARMVLIAEELMKHSPREAKTFCRHLPSSIYVNAAFLSRMNYAMNTEEHHDVRHVWTTKWLENYTPKQIMEHMCCVARLMLTRSVALMVQVEPYCFVNVSFLHPIRVLISLSQNEASTDALSLSFVKVLSFELSKCVPQGNTVLNEMQSKVMNLDVVEIVVRFLCKRSSDEHVIAAAELLSILVTKNVLLAGQLYAIVIPSAVRVLKHPIAPKAVISILNLLAASTIIQKEDSVTATALSPPPSFSTELNTPPPKNTADAACLSINDSFEPFLHSFVVFRSSQTGPFALCQHCASAHPPLQTEIITQPNFCGSQFYYVCQCALCAPAAANFVDPEDALTWEDFKVRQSTEKSVWRDINTTVGSEEGEVKAMLPTSPPRAYHPCLALLRQDRCTELFLSKLKTLRIEVVNEMCRLALHLNLTDYIKHVDFAVEVFCCLLSFQAETLFTCYMDAVLYLGLFRGCEVLQKFAIKSEGSAITNYLFMPRHIPQQQPTLNEVGKEGKETPKFVTFAATTPNAKVVSMSPGGLTPSPLHVMATGETT